MATFQIKTLISAVDNISGPLADINKAIKQSFKPFRDLYNSTKNLEKQLGFPKVGRALGGVSKAFGGVTDEIKALGTDIAWVAGGAAAAISALAWRTTAVGDTAAKTAQKVGISTQAWTELAHAGSMSGVAASTLQGGLTRLNKNISEAARGGKNASAMFGYLGISIYDAEGNLKTADVVMSEAADKLNQIDDSAHRSALAAELFGRSAGPEMLPLLKEGTAGIDVLRQEAVALGITFNDMEGKQAEGFGDAMERITAALDGVIFTIGKQLLPPLTVWADKLRDLIVANRELIGQKVSEWIQRIQDYLPTLEEKLKALWSDVSGFAVKVDELVQSFGGWGEVLPYVAAGLAAIALGPLISAIASLSSAFIGLGVAIMTTPIGWIIAGIAAVAAAAYYLYQNWDWLNEQTDAIWEEIKTSLGAAWEWIKNTASSAWTAVVETIKSIFGPIIDYFNERIDAVKTAFDVGIIKGIQAILQNFHPVRWIVDAMDAITKYLFDFSIKDAGEKIINSLLDGLKAAWDGVVAWFKSIGESVSGLIPESVISVLETAQSIGGGITDAISGAAGSVTGAIGDWWNGTSDPVPAEQSAALQFAEQRAAREQAIRGQVNVDFGNVPRNVNVDSSGAASVSVRRAALDPWLSGQRMIPGS